MICLSLCSFHLFYENNRFFDYQWSILFNIWLSCPLGFSVTISIPITIIFHKIIQSIVQFANRFFFFKLSINSIIELIFLMIDFYDYLFDSIIDYRNYRCLRLSINLSSIYSYRITRREKTIVDWSYKRYKKIEIIFDEYNSIMKQKPA